MRLISLTISHYKNLRNFSLSFDSSSFVDVFVGKNVSGKSNLLEALTEIFRQPFLRLAGYVEGRREFKSTTGANLPV